jgi:hypothetical protein
LIIWRRLARRGKGNAELKLQNSKCKVKKYEVTIN